MAQGSSKNDTDGCRSMVGIIGLINGLGRISGLLFPTISGAVQFM